MSLTELIAKCNEQLGWIQFLSPKLPSGLDTEFLILALSTVRLTYQREQLLKNMEARQYDVTV